MGMHPIHQPHVESAAVQDAPHVPGAEAPRGLLPARAQSDEEGLAQHAGPPASLEPALDGLAGQARKGNHASAVSMFTGLNALAPASAVETDRLPPPASV